MKFSDFLTFIGMVWFSLFFIYIAWTFFLKSLVHKFLIYRRGIITSAEVVYFQDSLAMVQYRPLCYIKLKFQTEQGQIITENIKVLVAKQNHHKYKVGSIINIKYDPKNLKNISILGEVML
ncbi:DUF3592 domain-containing protein [Acinetobacter pittii]|uniref:DUF3592 domain-containing protein n=1 Tax=Acinetobacter pittii TaxID=48296 RepID=UPI00070A566E|nr:DUF3592 domain-containing protein [Acinetobacter pittii]KRI52071.1 hypothetical protein APC53_06315 [Acinetobacter pittii]